MVENDRDSIESDGGNEEMRMIERERKAVVRISPATSLWRDEEPEVARESNSSSVGMED